MATALTLGTAVTPIADTEYTFTTTGNFRIDVGGASYTIEETIAPGITKNHSSNNDGFDYSGLFPVGTDLKVIVEASDPLPEGVTSYVIVRELG